MYKFNRTWYQNIYRSVLRFFRNVKRLFQWFPILWEDYDWDYVFLLDIMIFKLDKMAKHHEKNGMVVGSPFYAKQIAECARLLKRVKEDNYRDEIKEQLKFHEKYGELEVEINERRPGGRFQFSYQKGGVLLPEKLQQEAKEQSFNIHKLAEEQKEKELSKALKIINRKLFEWWD